MGQCSKPLIKLPDFFGGASFAHISGMDQQIAIGVSVLYLALLLALTVPGGLVLLTERRKG